MRFIVHGDKNNPNILLIHGMANTSTLYDPILPYLTDYCVIVCELDGHSEKERGTFVSVSTSCARIEEYVKREFEGRLFGLLGFSLGGTIAVELLSRGQIEIEKTILDAAFNIKLGIMTYPYKFLFQSTIWCLKKGIPIPKVLVESVMGKGNAGIMDALYKGVSIRSIGNACLSVYTYEMKESIRSYKNDVVFWHGSNEPYPVKSAALLGKYLPQLETVVFPDMGHGQMLHEHPKEYADRIKAFIAS